MTPGAQYVAAITSERFGSRSVDSTATTAVHSFHRTLVNCPGSKLCGNQCTGDGMPVPGRLNVGKADRLDQSHRTRVEKIERESTLQCRQPAAYQLPKGRRITFAQVTVCLRIDSRLRCGMSFFCFMNIPF